MKKIIISFLIVIILFVFPELTYSEIYREPPHIDIEIPKVKPPQDFPEKGGMKRSFLEDLPHKIEVSWEESLSIWTRMYHNSVSFWEKYIKDKVIGLWNRIWKRSQKEIEVRKEILEEEIEKEKEAVQEKVKKTSESLWHKLLESIGLR